MSSDKKAIQDPRRLVANAPAHLWSPLVKVIVGCERDSTPIPPSLPRESEEISTDTSETVNQKLGSASTSEAKVAQHESGAGGEKPGTGTVSIIGSGLPKQLQQHISDDSANDTTQDTDDDSDSDVSTSDESDLEESMSPECQTFWVHEGLLVKRSGFFKAALDGHWKESDEKTIRLPEDHPDVFGLYVAMIYMGRLYVLPSESDTYGGQHELCELYILADKLQDISSKNLVVDALLVHARRARICLSSIETLKFVYGNTPDGSLLRELLVDAFVDLMDDTWSDEEIDDLPKEFLADLSNGLLRRRSKPKKKVIETCDPSNYYTKEPSSKKRKLSEISDGVGK
ncbi:hypothetical protein CC80DRAFT_598275 [Byssothecium circinans]|uniref:BTB domain-containing protein n=1 Tax=Byssothecium circinans TaxID=147558 RepID=A0A6A5TBW5_9PLEO|nr:hypothetical protein CC80DRAFT_598275 [Byssothecium circinans]